MIRIAYFHYNPLELFPPAMNMINAMISTEGKKVAIRVFTTSADRKFKRFEVPAGADVKIFRIGIGAGEGSFLPLRIMHYLVHYLVSIFYCVLWRPNRLFYVESMSAPAAIVLKNLFIKKAKLFVHYHEYMSPVEFARTPMMARVYRLECRNYHKAVWISHTNEDRMRLFRADLGAAVGELPERIMPNYPSAKWAGNHRKTGYSATQPLKIVYVGAVDLVHLHFSEFIDWVESQKGSCILDVISNQDISAVAGYAKSRSARYVTFKAPVPYFQLPEKLKHYDVGVILYKGTGANFMYNAPNKLFEYLNVGLDVWFPRQIKGIQPYTRTDSHPVVCPLDFNNLASYTVESLSGNSSLPFIPLHYDAETVYKDVVMALCSEN